MQARDVLTDGFGRLPGLVRAAVHGLTPADLHWTPRPGANSIGWLVWHLTRIQDDHVSEILGRDQVWVEEDGVAARFGLKPDPGNTGYGHTPKQVAMVRPESDQALVDYYDAVAARTHHLLRGVSAKELDRIVDESWDPPVTLGVRLVSVLNDDAQHVGQAAYVRGLLRRSKLDGDGCP